MTAKCKTQPFCRNCARPIRKRTETVYFGRDWGSGYSRSIPGVKPKSRAEAQRHVNGKIVSVRWNSRHFDVDGETRFIDQVSTWDGETYEDDLFDTGTCAQAFGRSVARSHNLASAAYNQAVRGRNMKEAPHNA